MHPLVRYLILILLAQILRTSGRKLGFDLSPVTDRIQLVSALSELLNLPGSSAAGRVVEFDLQTVGVDLSAEPLDEVLDFRNQHGDDGKIRSPWRRSCETGDGNRRQSDSRGDARGRCKYCGIGAAQKVIFSSTRRSWHAPTSRQSSAS